MASIHFQFHGARDELFALGDEWVSTYGLTAVVERFRPARAMYAHDGVLQAAQSLEADRALSHRHTPGAHELAGSGMLMLATAGSTVFEFDDVDLVRSGSR